MVYYSHLFKNFPQFLVIHIVKDFSVVSEPEVDVFLEFSCFLYVPMIVGNLISGSFAYSRKGKFLIHTLLEVLNSHAAEA